MFGNFRRGSLEELKPPLAVPRCCMMKSLPKAGCSRNAASPGCINLNAHIRICYHCTLLASRNNGLVFEHSLDRCQTDLLNVSLRQNLEKLHPDGNGLSPQSHQRNGFPREDWLVNQRWGSRFSTHDGMKRYKRLWLKDAL